MSGHRPQPGFRDAGPRLPAPHQLGEGDRHGERQGVPHAGYVFPDGKPRRPHRAEQRREGGIAKAVLWRFPVGFRCGFPVLCPLVSYCILNIKYRPGFNTVINALRPVKSILARFDRCSLIHKINAILKMDEIARKR